MARVSAMPATAGGPLVARIDEAHCIGCTLCIQACPFDAIVGAAKQLHTVIVDLCTGCDLCVAPCPVDCITMAPIRGRDAHWTPPRMDAARERLEQRNRRLVRDEAERAAMHVREKPGDASRKTLSIEQKRATIRAAVARVRARRAAARRFSP